MKINRRIDVKVDDFDSIFGSKWIKLSFLMGNTKEDSWDDVISIFDKSEGILRDLQALDILSDFSLWGDSEVLLSIEGDGPIDLVIRFLVLS